MRFPVGGRGLRKRRRRRVVDRRGYRKQMPLLLETGTVSIPRSPYFRVTILSPSAAAGAGSSTAALREAEGRLA
jgi:hypothetical protein